MSMFCQQSLSIKQDKLNQQEDILLLQQKKKAEQTIQKIEYNFLILLKKIPEQVLNMKGSEFIPKYQGNMTHIIHAFNQNDKAKKKQLSPQRVEGKKKIIKNTKISKQTMFE